MISLIHSEGCPLLLPHLSPSESFFIKPKEPNKIPAKKSETLNPGTTNPEIRNPSTTNSEILNPGTTNPEILNPGTTNPEILNAEIFLISVCYFYHCNSVV